MFTQARAATHPEEDVLGRVEAGGVDAGRVRRRALALDAAGETGDGALHRRCVSVALAARHRVRHHEVDGALRRPADLPAEEESEGG